MGPRTGPDCATVTKRTRFTLVAKPWQQLREKGNSCPFYAKTRGSKRIYPHQSPRRREAKKGPFYRVKPPIGGSFSPVIVREVSLVGGVDVRRQPPIDRLAVRGSFLDAVEEEIRREVVGPVPDEFEPLVHDLGDADVVAARLAGVAAFAG